jgi:uncharacterized protein
MSDAATRTFLGKGIAAPFTTDEHGAVKQAGYEDSVQQSVWIILGTAKGERVMRPDFGCGIHELVFDSVTAALSGRVASAVREALLRFEPRIDVRDVNVTPGGDGEVLLISVDYEVRATNNMFNLVYPFYLDAGAAA